MVTAHARRSLPEHIPMNLQRLLLLISLVVCVMGDRNMASADSTDALPRRRSPWIYLVPAPADAKAPPERPEVRVPSTVNGEFTHMKLAEHVIRSLKLDR
jgi:hypothetical protein